MKSVDNNDAGATANVGKDNDDIEKPQPTPTADTWKFTSRSSVGINRSVPIADQFSAIRTINAYLASHTSQTFLKPPFPSANDISETLRFALNRLDFPPHKIEEDLFVVLKQLDCPINLNKSALRDPHSWPILLEVIHWRVQIEMYNESSQVKSIFDDNSLRVYVMVLEKLQQLRGSMEESVKAMAESVKDLEGKLVGSRKEPSVRELVDQKERSVLEEEDENVLEEKEKELEAMVGENRRICDGNEELKKRIELQVVEVARNSWEEKSWDLDATIGHKFKELKALLIECNQRIKRFCSDDM
ncbi:hypothetical protein Acr_07g0008970 [Actinidia rufa]|uniref:Kinetochore protein NDC80 n=1 Tax=Actinidia rufa TaxID=165716 RepID=A0A7J0EWD3_9ERIC|nr:hypothetical protein Acr_07g0008970 [Actinidia rufa]